jgi:TonB family protein
MIKISKTISFIFFILLATTNGFSQTDGKDVSITASGSGKSQEDAKQAALRSATEQAFGAFISSKTEMFNDQVVADQMASVSSGNIKSYEVLNESQLPDGSWGVTLKALVSISKLTSFVQAKGIAIEIKGGIFAINIKQQLLNEKGEINVVSEMVGLLHEPMQTSFDYVIKTSEPKSLDNESKNWEIPLVVTASTNKNIDFCANYFIKTIDAISLDSNEVEVYRSLNKKVFEVTVNYKNATLKYYLRKQESLNLINIFANNWEYYVTLFEVKSGNVISFADVDEDINKIIENGGFDRSDISFNFLSSGDYVATFSKSDKRTLEEISQITGYSVKPLGVVSNYNNGGYVLKSKEGKLLIVSLLGSKADAWYEVDSFYENYSFNGYDDWRLPTEDELLFMYTSFIWKYSLRGLTETSNQHWYIGCGVETYKSLIRPVRSIPTLEDTEAKIYKVNSKIRYPAIARENDIKGKVTVSCVVGADGVAKNFKVVEGIGFGCEEEVINYLKKIDWIPKVQNGRPIGSEYVFTFSFGLN